MSTTIEWTQEPWNPTTGCDRVSPGCDNCYALKLAKRLKGMGSAKYQNDGDPRTSGPGFGLTVHGDVLTAPLSWRRPRRVFVNSMSDLFHDNVPTSFVARVFSVMARTPQHTYQLLTKRHGRMRSLLNDPDFRYAVWLAAGREMVDALNSPWPLANVWVGVSVEDQHWAGIRVPALIDTPAEVRFLSCEPLLGPIDLNRTDKDALVDGGIDWVIVGGESGPGARPMHPDWARLLRDQCTSAGVPFFFKQWGNWAPHVAGVKPGAEIRAYPGAMVQRVGKKLAGRELDGRTWDEYPVVSHV